MKRSTSILCVIGATISISCIAGCASNLKQKCDDRLFETIERYKGATIDTLVTLEVVPVHILNDEERNSLMRSCELLSAERMDTHMMVTCFTSRVGCLADSPLIVSVHLAQPWSPDL